MALHRTLDREATRVAHHLLQAKRGLERAVQLLEDSGAPWIVVDETAENLSKVSDVLATYSV